MKDEETSEIYTSGATNILKYPELSDKEKMVELLSTLRRNRDWKRGSTMRQEIQKNMGSRYILVMNRQWKP